MRGGRVSRSLLCDRGFRQGIGGCEARGFFQDVQQRFGAKEAVAFGLGGGGNYGQPYCIIDATTEIARVLVSVAEELPELEIGDLVYAENIGAYSIASSTCFNGFPPAKIVHINK